MNKINSLEDLLAWKEEVIGNLESVKKNSSSLFAIAKSIL